MPSTDKQSDTVEKRPRQQRALRTEKALLDALENLLSQHSFADITVSQIAAEAGLTTGAIYRRFKDKEDLLHSAFVRFYDRTAENASNTHAQFTGLSDRDIIATILNETLRFTLTNVPLMRAANSVNNTASFELMTAARSLSARFLAELLQTSSFSGQELEQHCKFALRVATATFRDTFLSGSNAVWNDKDYVTAHQDEINMLLERLTDMTALYLAIAPQGND